MRIKRKHLKDLLERAFEAGSQSQIDAQWYSQWDDFDTWYKREFMEDE